MNDPAERELQIVRALQREFDNIAERANDQRFYAVQDARETAEAWGLSELAGILARLQVRQNDEDPSVVTDVKEMMK